MRWLANKNYVSSRVYTGFNTKKALPCIWFAFCGPCHLHKRLFDRIKRHRIAYFSFTVYQFWNSNTARFQALRKRPAHDAKRLQCAWAASQRRGVLWVVFNMADTNSQTFTNVTPSCDHKALKECLDRNNGDRSKCIKEWEDFQRSCAENKR